MGNVTSYDDNALTNGTTYYYQVSAVNAIGEGPRSNEVSATPGSNRPRGAHPHRRKRQRQGRDALLDHPLQRRQSDHRIPHLPRHGEWR